jgi:hypothetical protein
MSRFQWLRRLCSFLRPALRLCNLSCPGWDVAAGPAAAGPALVVLSVVGSLVGVVVLSMVGLSGAATDSVALVGTDSAVSVATDSADSGACSNSAAVGKWGPPGPGRPTTAGGRLEGKSRHADAMTLANILPGDSEVCHHRGTGPGAQGANWRRTKAHNELPGHGMLFHVSSSALGKQR